MVIFLLLHAVELNDNIIIEKLLFYYLTPQMLLLSLFTIF